MQERGGREPEVDGREEVEVGAGAGGCPGLPDACGQHGDHVGGALEGLGVHVEEPGAAGHGGVDSVSPGFEDVLQSRGAPRDTWRHRQEDDCGAAQEGAF